ncbi:MAG: hypothetical protein ACE5KV_08810 [Thermoplasmata archaeon]
MSIELGGLNFGGPFPVSEWESPRESAVYAIMMRDPAGDPNRFRILYFGESENLSERGFWRSHQKFGCWINKAGSTENLFIGVHPMPNSTQAERRSVESRLIAQYGPDCND